MTAQQTLKSIFEAITEVSKSISSHGTLGDQFRKTKKQWFDIIYKEVHRTRGFDDKLRNELIIWMNRYLVASVMDRLPNIVVSSSKALLENHQVSMGAHSSKADTEFFHFVCDSYQNFKTLVAFISTICSYLDSNKKDGIDAVERSMQKSFHAKVYLNLKVRLAEVCLRYIDTKRSGDIIDHDELRRTVSVFVEIGKSMAHSSEEARRSFAQDFKNIYLMQMIKYYALHRAAVCVTDNNSSSNNNGSNYVRWVQRVLHTEKKLAEDLLDTSSVTEVSFLLTQELLRGAEDIVLHPTCGLSALILDDRTTDIRNMYAIFSEAEEASAAVGVHAAELMDLVVAGTQAAAAACVPHNKSAATGADTPPKSGQDKDTNNDGHNEPTPPLDDDGTARHSPHPRTSEHSIACNGGGGGGVSVSPGRARAPLKIMASVLQKHIVDEVTEVNKTFVSASPSAGPATASAVVGPQQQQQESIFQSTKNFIESYLALQDKYTKMINELFLHGELMFDAQKEALRKGFSVAWSKEKGDGKTTCAAMLLAVYIDHAMRGDLKDIVDPDAELERLDKLVRLFMHLEEKDIFQDHYKTRLAKRLLQTQPNESLEKHFLEKLQRKIGKGFTSKLEGMMNDRAATYDIADRFRADPNGAALPVDFTCSVLTEGHWPQYKVEQLLPSPKLQECIDSFTRYYKKTHATRRLNWIHMLGSANLTVKFPKGVKDVQCSVFQSAILCAIDARGAIAAKDLASTLKVDLSRLVPHIHSMYISKQFPLIVKVDAAAGALLDASKDVTGDCVFSLNAAFQHKTRRFKLPTPQLVSNYGGPKDEDIDARRSQGIDACLVRIMKSKRSLRYNEVISLTLEQLSKVFLPKPLHIKKRIEFLIDRGFMERSSTEENSFNYLA